MCYLLKYSVGHISPAVYDGVNYNRTDRNNVLFVSSSYCVLCLSVALQIDYFETHLSSYLKTAWRQ